MTIKYISIGFLTCVCVAACVSGGGEGAPDAVLEEGADAIITFPAAAYASAPAVAYGATTARAFRAADGFVAVKFNAAAGDLLRVTVAASRATRSYLVFGGRNQTVLTDPTDAPGVYRFRIGTAGEYFIMMRSNNRRDLAMTVRVENLTSVTAGAFYSAAELLARTPTGSFPAFGDLVERALTELPPVQWTGWDSRIECCFS